MQGKEPATCLVNALIDEIAGEGRVLVDEFGIFERIVYLGIRHGAGVKPNVNQVGLTLHGLTGSTYQHDVVHIRTVQVYLVVVLLRHIARHKAGILQGIRLHEACLHRFLDFIVQLLNAANADFLSILTTPDRQRSTPETGTGEVPVVQVIKPVSKTASTG